MAFVLFWRCIVCSGKYSSCLPRAIKFHSPSFTRAIKFHSPSFTFAPCSLLSSSSSSCFTPSLNIISDLLTKECGFSSSQVTTVMRRAPLLLRNKSDNTAREVIHLLRDPGFTENKLTTTILRYPLILTPRADRQLRPKMEFLKKMGLSTQDSAHIILNRPRLLSLSLENCLAPRILHLETLFGSKDNLCKALRIAPRLLVSDFQKQVKPKVEYVKNSLGTPEGSTAFARALSVVTGVRFETLEAKIENMASLGLAEKEIGQILKKYPEALRYSTKKMKESRS
ncbi:transcription termination factor MTERF4, chloroplastic [Cryptomeria japonica]|uniref:transcription termination factor MTERF4, chloroplastic n=1 Tax=Cryptomeria japonica TaxID=3369 RepID=UPI0027DA95EC|nr:transcription termination factor MTERF4, chloroplastic [Cryptomeria japonica]